MTDPGLSMLFYESSGNISAQIRLWIQVCGNASTFLGLAYIFRLWISNNGVQ